MLRHDLAADLRGDELAPGHVRPDYGGYCFASVPATVADLVGAGDAVGGPRLPADAVPDGDVERVALVLVDGFGFEQFERHRGATPFLSRLAERARVTPLTSVFPSETTAAMTTYYLGAPPLAHGLLGWNVHRPEVDAVVKPLPFETAAGADPASLGLSREDLRAGRPVGPRLVRAGVDVRRVVPAAMAGDDDWSGGGGQTYYGYGGDDRPDGADALARELGAALADAGAPGVVHAYAPAVDGAGHRHGTRADEYRETVAAVLASVGRAVEGMAPDRARETLVVVCADHGHVDTDPGRNVDLLDVPAVASVVDGTAEGTPRVSGSPRNVHLHLDGEDPAAVAPAVEEALAVRDCEALVLSRAAALAEGLWGPGEPSAPFERHCGDLVVLPRELSAWHGDEPEELAMVGMHGGLHPDEMLVPFAAARADRLR